MPEPTPLLRLVRPGEGIVVLTLDDPARRNAMTEAMTAQWTAALAGLRDDPALRVVVVTGGGGAFCSGGDTAWIAGPDGEDAAAAEERLLAFYRAWLAVRSLPVPVVVAVDGPAVGAGLCLALAGDVRVAGPRARFAAPFTRLGIAPGMGATALLPAAVGPTMAADLLLSGRVLDAAEALAAGLVSRCLPADGFDEAVLELARAVARAAPLATAATVPVLRPDLEAVLRREARTQAATVRSAEAREGLAAVRARRTPVFEGR